MKYRIVEPRMFMVSRAMESWPRAVILTVRRATFIWGVTEEMVPWTMVPDAGLVSETVMSCSLIEAARC